IEATTDAAGQAPAQITPTTAEGGATQVHIEILLPENGEKIRVGGGFTTISWTAPGLAVRHTGPAVGTVGANLVYRIEVSNPGNLPAREVTVEDTIPAGWQVVSSQPQVEVFGDRLRWRVPELAPQASAAFEITFRADRE